MENISYEELMSYFIPLAKAIIIFIVGWVASKWANRITYSLLGNFDPSMRGFLAGVVQYTVLAATVIASMEAVGVKTTSLVAVLASAGLAVGMALQGSLANFASGIMILIFRPFKLGDKVTAGGQTGAVMDIGIFATTLKNPILDTIIIPNSAVTSSCITNHTVEGNVRSTVDVGVAYGSKVEIVIPILEKVMADSPIVLDSPAPEVYFKGLGASSLDFELRVWSTPANWGPVQHTIRTDVYNALAKANIQIPFTQLVIHNPE